MDRQSHCSVACQHSLDHYRQHPRACLPDHIPKSSSDPKIYGYSVSTYDWKSNRWTSRPKIIPIANSSSSFLMHMGIIPEGNVALLYWIDIDGAKLQARVRGRFISSPYAANLEKDYDLGLDNATTPHTFNLKGSGQPGDWYYWYEDYQHSGAYFQGSSIAEQPDKYFFFPIWREPGNRVYYSQVSLRRYKGALPPTPLLPAGGIALPQNAGAPIVLSRPVHPV